MTVTFKYTIQSSTSGERLYGVKLPFTGKNSKPVGVFRGWVTNKYSLQGYVSIHRCESKDQDPLGVGPSKQEIVGDLILDEGEHIFVLYNNTINVVPGGVGTGANAMARDHHRVLAQGGQGTGGCIEFGGNRVGGDGIGGDAVGKNVYGSGGQGLGAPAFTDLKGSNAQGGDAVGGRVVGMSLGGEDVGHDHKL